MNDADKAIVLRIAGIFGLICLITVIFLNKPKAGTKKKAPPDLTSLPTISNSISPEKYWLRITGNIKSNSTMDFMVPAKVYIESKCYPFIKQQGSNVWILTFTNETFL